MVQEHVMAWISHDDCGRGYMIEERITISLSSCVLPSILIRLRLSTLPYSYVETAPTRLQRQSPTVSPVDPTIHALHCSSHDTVLDIEYRRIGQLQKRKEEDSNPETE